MATSVSEVQKPAEAIHDKQLLVTSSPHLRSTDTTSRLMLDVIIALLPAAAVGVYRFGPRALMVMLVTIIACIVSEYGMRRILGRENTVSDLSAVVTGILLAMNYPATIPLWIAAVGGVIAIVLVKQMFGGIGQNFMNPALVARVFLLVSWPVQMTNFVAPGSPDAVSAATPLAIMRGSEAAGAQLPGYLDMFLGNVAGCIGETSVAALLIGGLYLVFRKVITLEIPAVYIVTTALFVWIFGGEALFSGDVLAHVLSGGLILGAFFMATDYTTSPVTRKGRIIMGIGCGILTGVIRLFTNYPEGVSFAILLMNIVTPLIDRYTVPTSFGGEKANA